MQGVLVALVCVTAGIVCDNPSKRDFTGYKLLAVTAQSKSDVEVLKRIQETAEFEELDFWTEPSLSRNTDIVTPPHVCTRLEHVLEREQLPYTVIHQDIQRLLDDEGDAMSMLTRTIPDISCTKTYCRYEKIVNFLKNIAVQYAERVEIKVIGHSSEGLNLYQVKIALNLAAQNDAVWIEAGTHAREWISISSGLVLIQKLAANVDKETMMMLSRYDWYIIPVHNPDGYEFSHTNDRLWRKNRQSCNSSIGIDLNRNWGVDFRGSGTSTSCSSNKYGGNYPFEAPEVAALRSAVLSTPNVFAFFSLHSYSQMLLIPYAYTSIKPRRYLQLILVAKEMVQQIRKVNGANYQTASTPDILYTTSGTAFDYFYSRGVPYSYTYELTPESSTHNGFILDPGFISITAEEVFASLKSFASMQLPWPHKTHIK